MRRAMTWLACAALVASPAWGEDKDKPAPTGTVILSAQAHWIGAMCQPTDAVIREQLDLDDAGLTVFQVLPDSPAAQGGLKMHDVITRIDGKPMSTVPQLMEAVADGKKLTVEIIRSGKKESLTIQPEKRPQGDVLFSRGRQPDGEQAERIREFTEKMQGRIPEGEARQMQEWLEKFRRGEQQPLRMHMFGPGVVMHSAGGVGSAPLPEDVTVTIKKTGAGPTAITVERGDETWTLNDKELHRLPKELQSPVGAMVGGGPMAFSIKTQGATATGAAVSDSGPVQVQIQTSEGGPRAFTLPLPPGAAVPPQVVMPLPSNAAELENLKKQVEQLQKKVDELQKKTDPAPAEPKKRIKSKEAT